MNLAKIESVRVEQTVMGRLFGFGSIIVTGTGSTMDPVVHRRSHRFPAGDSGGHWRPPKGSAQFPHDSPAHPKSSDCVRTASSRCGALPDRARSPS